jgi:hypothetical protein
VDLLNPASTKAVCRAREDHYSTRIWVTSELLAVLAAAVPAGAATTVPRTLKVLRTDLLRGDSWHLTRSWRRGAGHPVPFRVVCVPARLGRVAGGLPSGEHGQARYSDTVTAAIAAATAIGALIGNGCADSTEAHLTLPSNQQDNPNGIGSWTGRGWRSVGTGQPGRGHPVSA